MDWGQAEEQEGKGGRVLRQAELGRLKGSAFALQAERGRGGEGGAGPNRSFQLLFFTSNADSSGITFVCLV